MHQPPLQSLQQDPQLAAQLCMACLAWLALEAEHACDDLTLITIQDEVMRRDAWRAFVDNYLERWDEHAAFRGYSRSSRPAEVTRAHR